MRSPLMKIGPVDTTSLTRPALLHETACSVPDEVSVMLAWGAVFRLRESEIPIQPLRPRV